MKKFAYCIGGCRETPPYLDVLTTDRSDCFPIFFRKPGPEGSIFFPNSTTNTGRNRAFAEASQGDYEYVIIMDDDAAFEAKDTAAGFRRFEALLDKYHPAIASPRYPWHLKDGNLDKRKPLQGISASDAFINAFHRDVWWTLLPYWTAADDESWWNSAHLLHRVASILYPGCFIQFNELGAVNEKAEAYPRQGVCIAADAYMMSMLRPEWEYHYEMHESPASFRERFPVLRQSYRLTREEVGRYFKLDHEYWKGRTPELHRYNDNQPANEGVAGILQAV